jgi:hypothetical protein
MDRRQMLSAAVVALGGTLVGFPASAAELAKKKKKPKANKKWVLLDDPTVVGGQSQLCFGGFLFATKGGAVPPGENKLLGAFGRITKSSFTGTLLKQVPPYTHPADALPVILHKDLSDEAQDTTLALNETIDVIAALLAPNRDALDQINIAVQVVDRLTVTIDDSEAIAEEDKPAINELIDQARRLLLEADGMIRELPQKPSFEQLLPVADKVFEAARALQEVFKKVPRTPPT